MEVLTDKKLVVAMIDTVTLILALVLKRILTPDDASDVMLIWVSFQPVFAALILRMLGQENAAAIERQTTRTIAATRELRG